MCIYAIYVYIYTLNIIMPLIFGIGSSCRYAYLIDGLYTDAFLDQRSHRCLVPDLDHVHESRLAVLYTFMLHISRGGVCWRCVRRARRHTCPSPTQHPCLSLLGLPLLTCSLLHSSHQTYYLLTSCPYLYVDMYAYVYVCKSTYI